jgi:hypothetical protein
MVHRGLPDRRKRVIGESVMRISWSTEKLISSVRAFFGHRTNP